MTGSPRDGARPATRARAAGRPAASGPARPPVLAAGPRLAARARQERRSRRTGALRRLAVTLAVLAPVGLLVWLLTASSVLAVQQVTVSGERRLTAQQVRDAAAVVPGTPLARLDTAAVAARVRLLAPVASVSVGRSWPHGVRIRVTERQPVAGVLQGRSVVLLDRTGVAFATGGSFPRGVVALTVAHPGPSDPATRAALTVLTALPPALRGQTRALAAASPEQVQLTLVDGRTVVWGGAAGADRKVPAVLALLRQPGTVFDVSAPGVVTRR